MTTFRVRGNSNDNENSNNNFGLGRPPKVLVVEDQPDLLDIVLTCLSNEGYQLLSDLDPIGGLELAKIERPDVILLDVMMPQMNGFEVCQQLQQDERTKNIPVIFVTAMDRMEHVVKGLELGACDYITKPFDLREIRARVRATLRRSTAIHQMTETDKDTELPLNGPLASLTKKELEVLRSICHGNSNKDIAEFMDVSPFTVKNHISNIFRKLNTSSRTEAARIGILANLV